jgi:O-antigen/teichoic acid export membrane protein
VQIGHAPLGAVDQTPYALSWAGSTRRSALFDFAPLLFLGVSTTVRLVAGFVLLKYLALQFGPGTFGLLTQVMGIAAIFYMFAGGGITNGLIRNISAAHSAEEHERWMSAGMAINALTSVALAVIAITLGLFDGGAILGDPSYRWLYLVIAITQVIVGAGNLVLAYFSGIGNIRTFATAHIAGNALSLLFLIVLVQAVGFGGALLGVVLAPAIASAIALWQFLLREGHRGIFFRISWEPPLLKNLFSYAAVMVCGATAVPLAQLMIRLEMSQSLGWSFVGYWQAVAKVSDAYMLFAGVVFINYLLPKLSRLHQDASALRVLWRFGASMFGIFILASTTMYVARNYVILIIYSRSFLPASDLVLPQLVGDAARIAVLSLQYYFMSRRRVLVVITLELMQGSALYVFYLVLAPSYGAMAPVYSHVVASALVLSIALGMLRIAKSPVSLLQL